MLGRYQHHRGYSSTQSVRMGLLLHTRVDMMALNITFAYSPSIQRTYQGRNKKTGSYPSLVYQ